MVRVAQYVKRSVLAQIGRWRLAHTYNDRCFLPVAFSMVSKPFCAPRSDSHAHTQHSASVYSLSHTVISRSVLSLAVPATR